MDKVVLGAILGSVITYEVTSWYKPHVIGNNDLIAARNYCVFSGAEDVSAITNTHEGIRFRCKLHKSDQDIQVAHDFMYDSLIKLLN